MGLGHVRHETASLAFSGFGGSVVTAGLSVDRRRSTRQPATTGQWGKAWALTR